MTGIGSCTDSVIVIAKEYNNKPVTEIGERAFYNCNGVTKVLIGNNVTSIGDSAFSYCSSLTSVYYQGTAEEWGKISIDAGNSYLINATRYYYSETEQAGCWYYNEQGVPTLW